MVACHRWHPNSWSAGPFGASHVLSGAEDGSFQVSIFVDQLRLNRRPAQAAGPVDRELHVRNLPLPGASTLR